jgi:hypothetical protein
MKELRQRQVTFLKATVPQFMEFFVRDIDESLVQVAILNKACDGYQLLTAVWT